MLNIQDTSYHGHASAYLITRPVAKAETFTKGVCVMQETDKQFVLRRLEISNFIQPYAPTPVDGSTITYDANIIPIYQFNIYTEFNPVDLKETWSAEDMARQMVDLPLAANDSTYLMAHMFDLTNLFVGQLAWRGDTNFDTRNQNPVSPTQVGLPLIDGTIAQNTLSVFNGWIQQIQNDPTAINIAAATFSSSNVVGFLQQAYNAAKTAMIGEYGSEGLRFLYSKNTQRLIEQAYNIVTTFKNWGYDSNIKNNLFLSYEMIALSEMPDNTIIATYANDNALRSQFWFVYNSLKDQTNLVMKQKAPNSDIWFIKGTLKCGVGVGFMDQIVCLSALTYQGF